MENGKMKLKDLLKESNIWDREFGQSLPTLEDAIENHQSKKLKEAGGWEAPDKKVYKELDKLSDKVYIIAGRYAHKADMETAIHTWMTGLHAGLKKRGYKIK